MTRSCFYAALLRAAAVLGLLSLWSPLWPDAALAADGLDFYKGKTVRIVVGYAPGGGYDAYARLVAPHLEARLGTSVIVENRPGAGGFNALSALLREPGDGLRILLLNGEAAVLVQLVEQSTHKFDLRKLAYLGRVSFENRTLVAMKGGKHETLDGFRAATKPVHFGSGDRIDTMGDPASILCHAMNMPCKLVTGYQGAPDAALAMQRGEIDAIVTSESQTASFLKGSPVVAVAILAPRKAPLLPGVPSIFDITRLEPERAKWLSFRADIADFGRIFIAPGDTPPDRLAVLEQALAAVLTDPKVQAEGERTNRPIAYAAASENRRLVESVLGKLEPHERTFIRNLLLSAY